VLSWRAVTDVRSVDIEGMKPTIVNSTFWNIADWRFRRYYSRAPAP
jgi:hypothetical protein